jgi:UDP-N-acetyl-D-glucosamine dehydrogenase
MGYVGLPLAVAFAEAGVEVVGIEADPQRCSAINAARSYIVDVSDAALAAVVGRGLLTATFDYSATESCDADIICLPTPLNPNREPDLTLVKDATAMLAGHVRRGQLVCLESTTYPGTTRDVLAPILEQGSGLTAGTDFHVAFSPERVDPGRTDFTTRTTPKVVGGLTPACTAKVLEVYGQAIDTLVPVTTPEVAEMTKLLENIFRSVNIALVNELAMLCDRLGIDIWEVIEAAASKPFGYMKFLPGPGLGGHCIPIDPFYLSWKAKEFDFRTRFIELAGEINTAMPYFVLEQTAAALNDRSKSLKGSKILVLGLAYKRDIDDLRESPSLTIIELFREKGAVVAYNDPYFPTVGHGRHYDLNMTCTPLDNLAQYDAVVIVTDHTSYDYKAIVAQSKLVVDTRNATKGINAKNIVRC